jgi:Flp pilus assembly protein CpaB
MKARGGRFLLILGAGLAVMAFAVVYIVMSRGLGGGAAASVPTAVPLTTIAVVNKDVPAYTILDPSNVVVSDVDPSTVPAGAATSPSAVYGKMTLVPITQGQAIQPNQITASGFSNILAKGEKAFSLAVPEKSTFGNAVTENDRVDVLWTTTFRAKTRTPGVEGQVVYEKDVFTSTKTLLQDIHVLRVINLRTPPPPSGDNGSGGAEAEQAAATSQATLASMYVEGAPYQAVLVLGLNDQQAEVLKFARENGIIDLTLRSSAPTTNAEGQEVRGDHDIEKTTGVTIRTLVEQYGLLAPPPELQP